MSCSRKQYYAASGDPTKDLFIRSPMLNYYATAVPYNTDVFVDDSMLLIDRSLQTFSVYMYSSCLYV